MRKTIPLLTLAGFLAACGDGPTNSGDTLTQAQAEELAGAIIESGFAGFGPAGASGGGANATITVTLNESTSCEGSGTVGLDGSWGIDADATGQSGTLDFDYKVTHSSCRVTGENGTAFTLNGDPNITVTGTFNFDQTTGFDGSLNYDGGVSWATEGMSGTCSIDLSANFDFSATGTGSATVSGNVCGTSISNSVSVSG